MFVASSVVTVGAPEEVEPVVNDQVIDQPLVPPAFFAFTRQ
jgi:hypothetical protein